MGRLRLMLLMVSLPVATALGLLYLATSPSLAQSGDSVMNALSPLTEEEAARILDSIWQMDASSIQASAQLTDVHLMPDYRTVPDVFPRVVVMRGDESLGDGYYFIASMTPSFASSTPIVPGQEGYYCDSGITPDTSSTLLIVNEHAQLVYYYHEPNVLLDFKRQPDGSLSYYDANICGFRILDSSYVITDSWTAGNGYTADVHDLQVLPNGHVLLLIYDRRPVDLSAYGGRADAQVLDLVVQELDTDHNVVFEWNSRDHFAITDTYWSLAGPVVDYVHGNAVELDEDGNLLISSRHLSEITKIDRSTGEIIWRLGGKHNQFTFSEDQALPGEPGVYFSFQHDIRRLPNGHITLFDDGNQFIEAGIRGSRGVEYEIDEVTKTITRVQEFRTAPETYSRFMGSMQRLPNDNTVIGWGGGWIPPFFPQPVAVTEFTPEGDAALQLLLLGRPSWSYRAFKFPWQGIPATPPTLIADTDSVPVTLYYSWNGATEVASYQVKGGLTPTGLETIAHQPKTDFEDSTPISDTSGSLCFFQVIPISNQGEPMQASGILYLGDSACATGLTADGALTATRVFTDVQATGLVTTTLTVLPGETTSPTLFVRTPLTVDLAAISAAPIGSNVRFKLQAFAGEGWSELSVFTLPVQLTIEYGALDLSRNPVDVMLRRWDEAQQTWSEEGVVLLERDVVKRRATYALDRPGEFALFVPDPDGENRQYLPLLHERSTSAR